MLQFMQKKNYKFEADYIEVVLNWRSSDERGLSQRVQMTYNYKMLNFLLDDLMPWHRQLYDFSTLEVNRLALYVLLHWIHIDKGIQLLSVHDTCVRLFRFIMSMYFLHRSLSGVRGLSRETLIALTTTIESREWMRRRCISDNIPLEHPRTSSTDDVECFFSVLRSMVGEHFTSKAVMLKW